MKPIARVAITALAFLVAIFVLGLLTLAYEGQPRGAVYALLSAAIVAGIPWLAWWSTGRRSSSQR